MIDKKVKRVIKTNTLNRNWTLKIMHSNPKGLSPVHYLSFSRKLGSFFTWLLLEETKGEMPRRLEPFFVSTSTCFKFDLVSHCTWLACGSGLGNEYLLKSQGDIHSGNTAPSRWGYDHYLTHEIFPIKKEVLRVGSSNFCPHPRTRELPTHFKFDLVLYPTRVGGLLNTYF